MKIIAEEYLKEKCNTCDLNLLETTFKAGKDELYSIKCPGCGNSFLKMGEK